jgi:hypothetical protein
VSDETDLIIYGMMLANKHANAAHRMYRPGPAWTVIPRGTLFLAWMTNELTSVDLFTIAVHIAAAMRSNTVPRTAKEVESRKVYVRVHMPL